MNLKSRVLLGVLAGVALLNAGLYVATDSLVMAGFLRTEREQTEAALAQTREVTTLMLGEFLTRMNDWAKWDDMARFAEDQNQEFVDANIEAGALAGLQWDTALVARHGQPDALLVGLDAARSALVAPDPELVAQLRAPGAHTEPGGPKVGLLVVGGTIWITASQDVSYTDGRPPANPARFVTCSRVNDEWLSRLRKFTARAVDFRQGPAVPADATEGLARSQLDGSLAAVHSFVVDDQHLAAFGWLPDLHGKPAVLVREDRDRPLLQQGRSILLSSLLAVAAVGGVLSVLALLAAGRFLRRLESLGAGVAALRAGSVEPVPVPVADELGSLATAFNDMSAQIVDRELSLATANGRLRLVLDSIGDGLVDCSLDGRVGEPSQRAIEWLGVPGDRRVWDWLFGDDDLRRVEFELGWSQLGDGFLPFAVAVDQLPKRFARGDQRFEVRCEQVLQAGQPASVLLVITDVTALVAREQAQREAAELQSIVANFARDPEDFERFLAEMQQLLERLVHGVEVDLHKRQLHTMKGNAAVYGFAGFAEVCHRVEARLAEGEALALYAGVLQASWAAAVARVRTFLPESGELHIHLSVAEHERFLACLREGRDPAALARIASSWRFQLVSTVFARLGRQARRTAEGLGKQVEVEHDDDGVRSDPDRLNGFWEVFVHLLRNAVDHGIETPAERLARGKPEHGRLRLSARVDAGEFVVTLTDDGAGIDWPAVAAAASRQGLPSRTHADLVAALFADGVSSRDTVTELSGRGLGLAAVRQAVDALGGRIDVQSRAGVGTTFVCRFPQEAHAGSLAVPMA